MTTKIEGYDKLAAFVAFDKGLSIFRRFSKLNVKNILYLQAEIVNLENELKDIIEEDKDPADPANQSKKDFPCSVWHLKDSQDEQPIQWKKFIELRALLNEYSKNIISYRSEICK
jgi:hypothetical protein